MPWLLPIIRGEISSSFALPTFRFSVVVWPPRLAPCLLFSGSVVIYPPRLAPVGLLSGSLFPPGLRFSVVDIASFSFGALASIVPIRRSLGSFSASVWPLL